MIPILFLIDELETWGGTERHLHELTLAMDRDRYQPIVGVLHGTTIADRFTEAGLEVLHLPLRRTLHPEGARMTARLAALMRARGVRLVVTYHTSADMLGPPAAALAGAASLSSRRDMGFTKKAVHVRVQRRLNHLLSGMAAVSSAVRDRVAETERYPRDRIRVIANGVDASQFAPRPPDVRAKVRAELGLAEGDLVVGTLANYDPIKGYDLLFDAAERLLDARTNGARRVRFLLPGNGPLLEELRARADKRAGAFLLPGNRKDVPEVLSAMDVFLLSSHSEGFSNALLQAMACALPCVATDVGGNRETLDASCGTLVPAKDADAIVRALSPLLESAERRRALGDGGRRRAQTVFTKRRMVRRYEALFDETLGEIGAAGEARARPSRRAAKASLAMGFRAARPLLRLAHRPPFLCLCYHRVLPELGASDPWLVVGAQTFERQLEALSRRYDFVTAEALARALAEGDLGGRPRCAITFDDGYADNLEHGLPVLRRFSAPATIYVSTDPVGGGPVLWFERVGAVIEGAYRRGAQASAQKAAAAVLRTSPSPGTDATTLARTLCETLKDLPTAERSIRIDEYERVVGAPDAGDLPRYLTWDEVRALRDAGGEIGSHTRTHPILPRTDDAAAADEIARSRDELAAALGAAPTGFAYPNGDCDDRTIALVRRAGYAYAVVAMPEQAAKGDPFRITRRCISEHSSRGYAAPFSASAFLAEVEGALDRLR